MVALQDCVQSEVRPVTSTEERPITRERPFADHMRGHLLSAAALVVIVFGLRFAEAFLVPVIIGVMIAAISSPAVNWLSRRGVPTVLSATLVLLVDITALVGVARLLLLAASDLQGGLPSYVEKFSALGHSLEHYLRHLGLQKVAAATWFSAAQASTILQSFIANLATGASHVLLVVFVVFFLLCELGSMGEKLRRLSANADVQFERVDSVVRQVQLYLVVKLWTSLLSGVGAFIVLKAAGVELALLLSLLCFLLHFIPNIGSAIGAVAALVFALVDRGVAAAATVGVALILVNTIIGNLIEPRMLGSRLGVSPFALLVGMLFWGWLWGPAGALLSVPILAATKIVLENIPDLAWISELADSRSPRVDPPIPGAGSRERHSMIGLGSPLGTYQGRRTSGPRATIPGFPLKRQQDPAVEAVPTSNGES